MTPPPVIAVFLKFQSGSMTLNVIPGIVERGASDGRLRRFDLHFQDGLGFL